MKYRLGEICDVVSGGTPSRATAEFWDGGTIPWIKIGNIQRKYVDEADEYITQAGLEGSSAKMLSAGTILFTIFATLGEVGILTIEACTNQAIAGITIKNQSDILTDYLYYFLKSQKSCIAALGRGVAQNNINLSILRNFEVPIPDLPMQKQIVAILDKTAKVVEVRQQQLQQLDELVKARFVEMFGDPVANEMGWDTLPLENACKAIVDCPHSTPSYTKEDTGFRCIRTSIVKKNRILWDEIEYIPEDEYVKRIQRKKPDVGDIVYTREGAILGIAAIIDRNCNVALGQRSMLLSPNIDKCASEFLCVAMNSDSFLDNALKGVSGSASPHINVGDIKAFRMIMPPIELQNQFVDFVHQVDKSKSVVQKALDEAQLLFDSLMQQYFG